MPKRDSLPAEFEPHPSNSQFKNMTGFRFGRLQVLGFAGRRGKWTAWWWRCECGSVGFSYGHVLRAGDSQSCGCLQRERAAAKHTKHGKSPFSHRGDKGHPQYAIWVAMMQRCFNSKSKPYPNYGGRGISVCGRWRHGDGGVHGFDCFLADVGPKPSTSHSLGRIDNDGDYSPENCHWETADEQLANRRQYKVRKDYRGGRRRLGRGRLQRLAVTHSRQS